MGETARARAWFATRMRGAPTMLSLLPQIADRIFNRPAPAGTPFPYVRMDVASPGTDLIVVGGARVGASPLLRVYVVTDKESTGSIEPIANRIDALFHAASGTVTNGVIWSSVRERGFDLPDTSTVPNISRLGGEYRVLVS